jgi:hypothetical protein
MDKQDIFCLSLEYMKLRYVSRVEWSKWNKKKDIMSPGIHTVDEEERGFGPV